MPRDIKTSTIGSRLAQRYLAKYQVSVDTKNIVFPMTYHILLVALLKPWMTLYLTHFVSGFLRVTQGILTMEGFPANIEYY